jgi:hypothetical protein
MNQNASLPKRVAARLRNGEAPVDLSNWTLNTVTDAQEFMEKVVLAAASEALKYAIEGTEGNPIGMSVALRSSMEEPLLFEVWLPLVSDDDGPQFTFTLRQEIEFEVEMFEEELQDRESLLRVLEELRSLTALLEQALSKPTAEDTA